MDDTGLNERVNLLLGLRHLNLGVNDVRAAVLLEVRNQFLGSLVVDLDLLSEDRRRNVSRIALSNREHSFLADILSTLQDECAGWSNGVLHKEFSLEFCLREAF